MNLAKTFWEWPDGWVWRVTRGLTDRSRHVRFKLFMCKMKPGPADRVLDIGAGEGSGRAVNFFEEWYVWRERVTAIALEDLPLFRRAYPEVKLVIGDGTHLPFPDQSFEIAFSNAVVEHVGSSAQQRAFIAEACRVSRRVFLSTPNRWFPIDAHTMIPFAHWLPLGPRNAIYRFFGRTYFASEAHLHLLSARDLLALLPKGVRVRIVRQRILGWTANINVIIERSTD